MMLILLACLCLGDDPEPLNAQILAFARSKLGEKVGNGECVSLATAALRDAGIRVRFGPEGAAWGEPRDSLDEARPGDILQFEDVSFVNRTKKGRATVTLNYTFPHHTAVLAGVKKVKGTTVLTILHQNAGFADEDEAKRKRVSEWTLSLGDLKGGTIRAYRPSAD